MTWTHSVTHNAACDDHPSSFQQLAIWHSLISLLIAGQIRPLHLSHSLIFGSLSKCVCTCTQHLNGRSSPGYSRCVERCILIITIFIIQFINRRQFVRPADFAVQPKFDTKVIRGRVWQWKGHQHQRRPCADECAGDNLSACSANWHQLFLSFRYAQ